MSGDSATNNDFPMPEIDANGVDRTQGRALLIEGRVEFIRLSRYGRHRQDVRRPSAISRSIAVDESEIRVLDLATLIEVKRRAGRPKDLAVLPVLEATLDERERAEKTRSL